METLQLDRKRQILIYIILATIPCYCLGIAVLQGSKWFLTKGTTTPTPDLSETAAIITLTAMPTITGTVPNTSTPTVTFTPTWTPSLTFTPFMSPTHTITNTPQPPTITPSETPSLTPVPPTLTPTETLIPSIIPVLSDTPLTPNP